MTDVSNVTPPRRQIPKRIRFEVLRRDAHTCRYCGAKAPDVPLTVDHVVPVALGGSDDPSNLVTACRDCNYGKASTSPDEHIVAEVDAKALEWAAAIERAGEIRRAQRAEIAELVQWFAKAWDGWKWTDQNGEKHTVDRGRDWAPTIERFIGHGLTSDDFGYIISVAMQSQARDTWRYFCKVCWKEIELRRDMAIAATGDG